MVRRKAGRGRRGRRRTGGVRKFVGGVGSLKKTTTKHKKNKNPYSSRHTRRRRRFAHDDRRHAGARMQGSGVGDDGRRVIFVRRHFDAFLYDRLGGRLADTVGFLVGQRTDDGRGRSFRPIRQLFFAVVSRFRRRLAAGLSAD